MPRGKQRTITAALALFGGVVLTPARADAQWFFTGSVGGNHTLPADVTIAQPALDTALTFERVSFRAEALSSPQYYSWHLGRFIGSRRRFGLEFEFIHLKVIAQTDDDMHIRGRAAGVPVDEVAKMNTRVEEYRMTHGLNFLLVNLVARMPAGGSPNGHLVALVARAGAGRTLPHAETNVDGQSKQQYEWAGAAWHVAIGLSAHLTRLLAAVADYKLTFAKPRITIADGTGRTTALTHQVAVGLAFGMPR